MTKCYNINDSVLFYPESGDVSSSLTGKAIKINKPTAQLFEVFITRVGVAVSQEELYVLVWGENSANVTPNTLYQNISLLRKALQDSGIPSDSLKTIRGKGFIFTVDFVVEVEENSFIKYDLTPDKTVPAEEKKSNATYLLVFILISVVISFGALYYYSSRLPWRVSNYNKDFVFISKINGCNIFNATKNKSIENTQRVNSLIKTLSLECEHYPYAYISYSARHSTVSIISCRNDINDTDKNDCKSEIFINHGDLNESQP